MSSTTVSTLTFLTFQHCILFVQLNLKSVLWFRQGSWNLTLWRLPAQSLSHVQPFVTPWTVAFPPGSSVHGIFQVRILKWVALPSSRGSRWHRDWTHISCISCIVAGFFTTASLVAQMVKSLPAMREIWVQSLGGDDPLEKGIATHSRILAWRIP